MCRLRQELSQETPLELLAMIPMLATWALGFSVRIQAFAKLVRILRVRRLLWYFSQRQEDLSADVRWIAGCKFIFILFATAHWIGSILFFFAADGKFSEEDHSVNWLSGWVEQESVQYKWKTAGSLQTYVVRFFTSPFRSLSSSVLTACLAGPCVAYPCCNYQMLPTFQPQHYVCT